MSEFSDSTKSAAEKRSSTPEPACTSPPLKAPRVEDDFRDVAINSGVLKNGRSEDTDRPAEKAEQETQNVDQKVLITNSVSLPASAEIGDAHPSTSSTSGVGHCTSSTCAQSQTSGDLTQTTEAGSDSGSPGLKGPPSCVQPEQSDWAAMAAAEALASLTRGGEDQEGKDTAHSSKHMESKKKHVKKTVKRNESPTTGKAQQTHAAAADSSTSSPEGGTMDASNMSRVEVMEGDEEDDEGDDFLSATPSTPSSSSPSDEDIADDVECSIVSVKMAPEMRQSVALLAQVQLRLEALEKKAARLHQQLELKLSQQRRPHLDQRSTIIQAIPGFWVTAFLNHPQLSGQVDENDEDALSYMTNLEIESFHSNNPGYRIVFHFRRNCYFQNNIIVKEFHHARRGGVVSFSNPILWHRGQNLTSQSQAPKEPGSLKMYPSFFSWFGDHSNPARDEIAVILKDDLYRNPLRYYLTPLWEPRQNGSGHQLADSSAGSECVVISDSGEEEDEGGHDVSRADAEEQDSSESSEEDEEVVIDSSGDSDGGEEAEGGGSSDRDRAEEEELDVEELDESQESGSQEAKGGDEEQEEEIEVGRENDNCD